VAPAAPLPQPMLARSGTLPTRGDRAYEVKWDGFRAIVSTEDGLRVRSRRGWNMTDLVPELDALPVFATLDGDLCVVADERELDYSDILRV
jgi:bifunctional non-homologous end joining protein LigD